MSRPASPTTDHPVPPDPLGLIPRLIHRDANILVLDKPAGLPVHKGPGGGVTLSDQLHVLRFGLPRDPELAHRLDKDTAGCLVLGRHRRALERLGLLFRRGEAAKTYWAVVEGAPDADAGEIDLPLAPRDPKRGWWMKVAPGGQPALTRFTVLGRAGGQAWLALEPVTGRTHQLRVHLAAAGAPVLNDPLYGDPAVVLLLSDLKRGYKGRADEKPLIARLALHASELTITHPVTREPLVLRSPQPHEFTVALKYLEKFGAARLRRPSVRTP